jgi:hypothetical protein
MATPYKYRHISGPWGLRADLTATSRSTEAPGPGVPVSNDLSLDIRDPNVTEEDREQLVRGLRHAAPAIRAAAGTNHVTVTVERFEYPLTDYQPEAAALAIVGWAAEHFGFPPLPTEIRYDRTSNRYDANLGEINETRPDRSPDEL